MGNVLEYKWKDIYVWGENNQVKKVKTIKQALKQGKAGYYVVCFYPYIANSKGYQINTTIMVAGTGKTVKEACEDVITGFSEQEPNQEDCYIDITKPDLPYTAFNFYLFPASEELIFFAEAARTIWLYKGFYTSIMDFDDSIFCKFNGEIALLSFL